MEHFSSIFTVLSAGAFFLLTYPGIFSRLSNDGKQSPALFSLHLAPFSTAKVAWGSIGFVQVFWTKAFLQKPTLLILGKAFRWGLNTTNQPNFIQS